MSSQLHLIHTKQNVAVAISWFCHLPTNSIVSYHYSVCSQCCISCLMLYICKQLTAKS